VCTDSEATQKESENIKKEEKTAFLMTKYNKRKGKVNAPCKIRC
jgi:hypothetical protein